MLRVFPDRAIPDKVQLPRSSTRLASAYAHVRVLTAVSQKPMGLGFEGKLYQPGQVITREELGAGVVLECVGPSGPSRGHRRGAVVWVLWRYQNEQWNELARSVAMNWEWTEDLRIPAVRALYPVRELADLSRIGREIATDIIEAIDRRLEREHADLKRSTFSSLYDRMAARMVG